MSNGLTIPTVADLVAKKNKSKKEDNQVAPDKRVTEAVNALALFNDDSIPVEIAQMVKSLNKKGIDNDKIATTLKKLLTAKKTIIVGSGQFAETREIPDNAVILAAVKFASALRNVIPAKQLSVKGKVDHEHHSIPQGSVKALKQREKLIQKAHEAEFEVLPDDQIN